MPSREMLGTDLLEMTPDYELDTRLTCEGPEKVTCDIARVNWDVIHNKENIILPIGDLLYYKYTLEHERTEKNNNSIGKTLQ